MNILVLGGTRFMGIHLTEELLQRGHQVTIATRGTAGNPFGERVKLITIERTDPEDLKRKLMGRYYDVVCDSLAYCSNDVKSLMEAVRCGRYVMISSASVYREHMNMREEDFDPYTYPLKWCSRADYPYDEIKRQAECALLQAYSEQAAVSVRFPFVLGKDDYTKRLYFYVEHTVKGIPMYIDNLERQLCFIHSSEAGRFLARLAEVDYIGTINGSSQDTISLDEIIGYVERKAGAKAICNPEGAVAPFNGAENFSLNTERAERLGFTFSPLKNYIYDLLDWYIVLATTNGNNELF